jgi:hypothetical protein
LAPLSSGTLRAIAERRPIFRELRDEVSSVGLASGDPMGQLDLAETGGDRDNVAAGRPVLCRRVPECHSITADSREICGRRFGRGCDRADGSISARHVLVQQVRGHRPAILFAQP